MRSHNSSHFPTALLLHCIESVRAWLHGAVKVEFYFPERRYVYPVIQSFLFRCCDVTDGSMHQQQEGGGNCQFILHWCFARAFSVLFRAGVAQDDKLKKRSPSSVVSIVALLLTWRYLALACECA